MKSRSLATAAMVALILGSLLLTSRPSYAVFLGLSNGTYDVTITSTGALSFSGGGSMTVADGFISAYDFTISGINFADSCSAPGGDAFCPGGVETRVNEVTGGAGGSGDLVSAGGALMDLFPLNPTVGLARFGFDRTAMFGGQWGAVPHVSEPAPVPEPASAALLVLGFSALGLYRRYFAK